MAKYGEDSFVCEVLESDISIDDANDTTKMIHPTDFDKYEIMGYTRGRKK